MSARILGPSTSSADLSRLPWTRARATRSWRMTLAALAAIRLGILATLPIGFGVRPGELASIVAAALAFPVLLISIVRFSEIRFLRRPPKGVLAGQLACFCAGATLQVLSLVSVPALEPLANVVLSGSAVLIGGWFVGVLLVPEE